MSAAALLIAARIHAIAPGFGLPREAAQYIVETAQRYGLDPLLIEANIENESRWQIRVERLDWDGSDEHAEEYVGLNQIRLRNFPVCAELHSPDCNAIRQHLFGWRANIHYIAVVWNAAREFCAMRTGSAQARFWLQLPTGYDAVRGTQCGRWRGIPLQVPKGVLKLLAASRLHGKVRKSGPG